MKTILFMPFILLMLPCCRQDIAGLMPAQRDRLYETAAAVAGKPQWIPVIRSARAAATTSAKQPQEVTL